MKKLWALEAGRAVAALLVVLHHADQASAHFSGGGTRWFIFGQYGVDFFFVLSGFIIYFAHHEDDSTLANAKSYAVKRSTRIFFPYLPVAICWMMLLLLMQSTPYNEANWSVMGTLSLLPLDKGSALTVAWTLTYELIFYFVFLTYFLSKKLFLLVSASWALLIIGSEFGVINFQGKSSLINHIMSGLVIEFLLGLLAAWAFTKSFRIERYKSYLLLTGGLGILAFAFLGLPSRWLLGVPIAFLVLGLASLRPRDHKFLQVLCLLGTASYSIYLVHSPVISVFAEILSNYATRNEILIICAVLGSLAGLGYHKIIEVPLNNFRKRLL